MSTWAIIVAAGSGSRFGGAKQFQYLGDRRVIDWSVDTAAKVVDGIVVVLAPDHLDHTADTINADIVVAGGKTRTASVKAGLSHVPDSCDLVVVHDAARPLASVALFERVIDAVRAGAAGAIPGVPVTDTIKQVPTQPGDAGSVPVLRTLERGELVAVQTPQAFATSILRRAHEADVEATDDAALVESIGGEVVAVLGEVANRKVTLPSDLVTLAALAGNS